MYKLEPKRTTTTTNDVAIVLCILAIYVGITTMGQEEILAEDKSTSITCTGLGPCEKSECVDGECETVTTNSSNISIPIESDVKGLDKDESVTDKDSDTHKSVADLLRDRLSMQEDRE